jgi:proteic killer suppression protein
MLQPGSAMSPISPVIGLKKLKGGRKGRWSVRINGQWRICFEWRDGAPGPSNVEIVDYH